MKTKILANFQIYISLPSTLFFSDKRININKITPIDNDKVIPDDEQACSIFSNFFQEAVKTLDLTDSFICLVIVIEIWETTL